MPHTMVRRPLRPRGTRTRTGLPVVIRRMRSSDAPAVRFMLERCSPASLAARFHMPVPRLTDELVRDFARVDRDHVEAVVAITRGSIAGVAHIACVLGVAEIAVLVDDRHRRRGIGTALAEAATAVARTHDCLAIEATIARDNRAALALARTMLGDAERRYDGPLVTVSASLVEAALSAKI